MTKKVWKCSGVKWYIWLSGNNSVKHLWMAISLKRTLDNLSLPEKNQPETLNLRALFGVKMFQRTARIVAIADSYSSRPLLLSLWMSAGPSEPEWPKGSTGSPAQRQFWRTFVSKSRFSQNLQTSLNIRLIYHLVYYMNPQKTTTNSEAKWQPYCKILFSKICQN